MKEKIYFAKTESDATIPSKSDEDAGYDVYPCFEEDYIEIKPHETEMIPLGIASAFSSKFYFQLFERGSTGIRGIGQRAGVIDSSYRGEWFAPITNHNNKTLYIAKDVPKLVEMLDKKYGIEEQGNGVALEDFVIVYSYSKAIAQGVLLPVPKVEVEEIPYYELINFESERGTGMLGSSNK